MLAHLAFVIRNLVKGRHGASSAEYAVVAALISVAAIAAMGLIGQELQTKMTIVANGFN